MGLRCLLGHDFGAPETEREREEAGNEVVVTVRDVRRCRRCDETQVVSENKEVKSVERPHPEESDGHAGYGGEASATGGARSAEASVDTTRGAASKPSGDVDDVIDAAEAEGEGSTATAHPSVEDPRREELDDVEDDAVIMDGESVDDADGADGEDADGVGTGGSVDGSEPDELDDEDAVVLGDDVDDPSVANVEPTTEADVDADEGDGDSAADWPDHDGVDEGLAPEDDATVRSDDGVRHNGADEDEAPTFDGAGEAVGRSSGGRTTVDLGGSEGEADLEYRCPECEMSRPVGNSSMRAGDICPECRRGYVEERER